MDKIDVKEIRTKLKMNQQNFAVKMGVGITTVSRWERGISSPSPLALEKLQALEKSNG